MEGYFKGGTTVEGKWAAKLCFLFGSRGVGTSSSSAAAMGAASFWASAWDVFFLGQLGCSGGSSVAPRIKWNVTTFSIPSDNYLYYGKV